MTPLDQSELAAEVLTFSENERSILFTGAGVGKSAGLPLWDDYLEYLATICDHFKADDEALLMRSWIKRGQLVDAAGIYEKTSIIPIGDRWNGIATPFRRDFTEEDLMYICHLLSLPFGGVVTTNYDSSQLDAYAKIHRKSPVNIELEGTAMFAGAEITPFYIARIHGNATTPLSMVLYPSSYERVQSDNKYQDFLLSLFNNRPCLFLGFSFLDPAINCVLEVYKNKSKGIHKTSHLALLPADPSARDLAAKLSELNIRTVFYSPDKGHRILWKAIRQASAEYDKKKQLGTPSSGSAPILNTKFHRFLSFAYAQIKLTHEISPLLQQAREGIIMGVIIESNDSGATEEQLIESLRDALALDDNEAKQVARDGVSNLYSKRQIRLDGDRFFSTAAQPKFLADSLNILVSGVLDRLKVQHLISPKSDDAKIIESALEYAFMVRAWDLGAHYAGGGGGYTDNLFSLIKSFIFKISPAISKEKSDALSESCSDLIQFPSNEETIHLAEISRAAFSLQLVLSSPRQSLFQKHSLPEIVYFDASILLPALVPGHPYNKLYRESIDRLINAAKKAEVNCRICVGAPFLKEILFNREKSIAIAASSRIDNLDNLRKMCSLSGAENINVFISGFAGICSAREQSRYKRISFAQYLQEYAPYSTEEYLKSKLEGWGFEVIPMNYRFHQNGRYTMILNDLRRGYEDGGANIIGKDAILVENEAAQLSALSIDVEEGQRAVFVSNDFKLKKATAAIARNRELSQSILSAQSFIGLIDIVVGVKPDSRGLARLLWAAPRSENDLILRNYFIKRALLEQETAYAKHAPDVISEILSEAKKEPKFSSIDLSDGSSAESINESLNFIDRFEDRFFEKMRRAIEKDEQ